MWAALKSNPVRVLSIVSALVTLAAAFVPGLPTVALVGLAAAILGVGEGVRSQVTPEFRAQARETSAFLSGAAYGPGAADEVR